MSNDPAIPETPAEGSPPAAPETQPDESGAPAQGASAPSVPEPQQALPEPPQAPEPQPPAAPSDAEIEAMFKRRWLRNTGIWDVLRAGLLAGSIGFSLVGILYVLDEVFDLIHLRSRHFVVILPAAALLSLLFALWKGFSRKSQGILDVVGRIVWVLITGSLIGAALFLVLALTHDTLRPGDAVMGILWLALGILLVVLSIRSLRRARREVMLHGAGQMPVRRAGPNVPASKKLAAYLWAGLLSATLVMWLVSLMIMVHRNNILHIPSSKRSGLVAISIVLSIILGASRGFPAEFRKHTNILVRAFANVLCTVLGGLFYLALSFPFLVIYNPSERKMAEVLSLVAMPFIALVLWRGRHIETEGRRGRWEAGVWGVLVVLITLYPQSAWLRYALGSGEGASTLAEELYADGEYARAASYAEIACHREEYQSCALAAHIYRMGLGVPASLKRAREIIAEACVEPEDCAALAERVSSEQAGDLFIERACDLGDQRSCWQRTVEMLGRRCAGKDAFACRELAGLNERGPQTWRAREFYQKACQFGDTVSCAHPSLR